jgi:hypothetical protein
MSQEEVIEENRKEQAEFDEEHSEWVKIEVGQRKHLAFEHLVKNENPKIEVREGEYGQYRSYTFKVVNLGSENQRPQKLGCSKKTAEQIFTGIERGYQELVIYRRGYSQYEVLPPPKKGEE